MKLIVFSDVRSKQKEGKIYAAQEVYTILYRYYNAFGSFKLCSRLDNLADAEIESDFISELIPINSFAKTIIKANDSIIRNAIIEADFIIIRMPSFIGYRAAAIARKFSKPYLVECMADPWDGLWNHGLAGKLIAPYAYFSMKKSVKNASYALYVTNVFLQKRFPCSCESVGVSNVVINEISDSILEKRFERIKNMNRKSLTIMTTAAVNVSYKGQQYMIKAMKFLKKRGITVKYILVGGGETNYLESIAKKSGVSDYVIFKGRKQNSEVMTLLDEVDIYIQPSLQEGLPRSLIEAMSRGVLCVGAKTGGIPELLEENFIVRRKSVTDLVSSIERICDSTYEERLRISKRNFDFSKNYLQPILNKRRNTFFSKIINDIKGHEEK